MIQTQYLEWTSYSGRGPGAQRRVLRQDPGSGAETFILRLPAGYALGDPALLENDTELFVLHGELEINAQIYHRDCYAVHPAGYAHNSFTSSKGATLVVITTGGPDVLYRGKAKIQFRRERLVERVDAWMLDWSVGLPMVAYGALPRPASPPTGTPALPPFAFSKLLWEDPDTKARSFLVAAAPRLTRAPSSSATVDEEVFVLQGGLQLFRRTAHRRRLRLSTGGRGSRRNSQRSGMLCVPQAARAFVFIPADRTLHQGAAAARLVGLTSPPPFQ